MRPKVERGLLECDFGDWTGAELATLMKEPEWQTVQRAPSTFRFPGGESFSEMQHRIVSTLDRLRDAHPGGTIVCVSHADPIKAAVAHALGTHLDLFQRIVISTCAISVVAWHGGGPAVLAVNSTGGSLKELQAVVSVVLRVRRGRHVHRRGGRRAGLARLLPPRPRRRRSGSP